MKDFLCSKKGNTVLLVVIAIIAYITLDAGFGLGGAIGGAIAGAIGAIVAMVLKAVLKPAESENDTPTASE